MLNIGTVVSPAPEEMFTIIPRPLWRKGGGRSEQGGGRGWEKGRGGLLSHYVGVCRYVTECVVGLGDSSAITVTIFCSKNIAIVKISRYLIIFANKYQKIHRHLLLLQKTVLVKVFSKEDQHVDILRQKTSPFFSYNVASCAEYPLARHWRTALT